MRIPNRKEILNMPLSVNSAIVPDAIDRVKMLKSNSVYLLNGLENDKLVIKREYTEQSVIDSSKSMAKTIDPRARLKVLIPAELAALHLYISSFEKSERDYEVLGMPFSAIDKKAVADLKSCMNTVQMYAGNFLKMDPVEVADLWTALEDRLGPNADKTDLRSFTSSLNARGGLEKLGQLIALDLFNDNTDRFNAFHPSSIPVGQRLFEMRCLTSPQNVFRIRTEAGFEVGVLDYIPLSSQFRNINIALAEGERLAGAKWPGRILADKSQRKEFAKDIVHDLEKLLHPNKKKYSLKTKLKNDPVSRIITGMVEGCRLMSARLEFKYYPTKWTQGIKDRALVLAKAMA
jgi:hypothetical protein